MIKKLSIQNFKSIENVALDCKRVNVFLGMPNTGKSNFLEAMTLLNYNTSSLNDIIRFENVSNLFTDYDLSLKIKVTADDSESQSWIQDDQLVIENWLGNTGSPFKGRYYFLNGKHSRSSSNLLTYSIPQIKFYSFKNQVSFKNGDKTSLEFPDGFNLPSVLLSNKELGSYIQEILNQMQYKLLINPIENRIEILKENGITIAFPFSTISDTIKKVILYTAAIQSNNNSILLFEEPDAHTFPFYTKEIALQVANDTRKNQFFIVTHSTYLLQALMENTLFDELQVNIVYMEDYKTKVRQISDKKDISELIDMEASAFFRLDEFINS